LTRALAAARAFQQGGALDSAERLAAAAEAVARDEAGRARVAALRSVVAYLSGDAANAPRLSLGAARQLETVAR
jgi:hypothetical protein